MFRFIHAADIHLDSPLLGLETYPDAPVEQIRGAVRRAFDNLIQLAIDEEVAFVVIAGDLFDGDWKDYNTGLFFMNRMGRLRERGIPVVLISGNHDAASPLTRSLHLPDNMVMLSSRQPQTHLLEDVGVAIHGQSFANRFVSENLSRNYPAPVKDMFNIGLLHTCLCGKVGHAPYAPCTLEELVARGYDYWALGHVHEHEIVARDPWVVFTGNIQGRHMREPGAKGCCLVSVDAGRVVSVEHRELDVLRFAAVHVDAAPCANAGDLFAAVREGMESGRAGAGGRALALRIVVGGRTKLHESLHGRSDLIREELQTMAVSLGDVWLEKLILATDPLGETEDDDSALSGLLHGLEALHLDEQMLGDLVPDWIGLQSKLPPEVREKVPGGEFGEIMHDVRALLNARLQGDRHEN